MKARVGECFADLDTLAPTFREARLTALRIRPSELNLEALGNALDWAARKNSDPTTIQPGQTVVWQGEVTQEIRALLAEHWRVLLAFALLNSLAEPHHNNLLDALVNQLGTNTVLNQGVVPITDSNTGKRIR